MRDLKAIIRTFLRDNFFLGDEVELADDDSLMERQIVDSTGFLELLEFVEKTFNFSVPEKDMVPDNFDSISKLERYLVRKGVAS